MDGDGETATAPQKYYQFMKKTLQFLLPVSLFSFLFSYFSGFPFFSYNLQFSTLIFSLSAQALERKYMFLICNGILAFLANNLNFSSSSLNTTGSIKSAEDDDVKQITELPQILEESTVKENVASMEYANSLLTVAVGEDKQTVQQQEQDYGDSNEGAEEIKAGEYCEEEVIESGSLESAPPTEEVNDARVSTEELNKKFEEFIRKMKEELRIEAQQQLITVKGQKSRRSSVVRVISLAASPIEKSVSASGGKQ
ncbi:hypothetical protein BUALT_Bualt03G0089400 [Buddleja alternifolia]|uniref:Uncharacterized protein n=1 Tax=Buddleja alternifolia TaxID=168488 RepID=A0AAV6XTR9_9LAMI|nr:hypothetical protein BUALT_Bualt03G0089400 [Buddleja alternifolia]